MLVPELAVSDLDRSLAFYCGLPGFAVLYDRPKSRFADLRRDAADLMLDAIGVGRTLSAAHLPIAAPYGRGLNLQLAVPPDAFAAMLARLGAAGHPLLLPVEEAWDRRGHEDVGQRQFVVADPDGYLLRPCTDPGTRAAGA